MNSMYTYIAKRLVVVSILLMVALIASAQALDVRPELHSMIVHQRQVHKVGLLRLFAVEARKQATDELQDNMEKMEQIDKAMDKVDKAFGLLDVIVSGGVTVSKIFKTYNNIKGMYFKTQDLVTEYYNICLKKGKVKESDSILITTCRDMINTVYSGVLDIYSLMGFNNPGGLIELAAAAKGGILSCSTDDMLFILEEICNSCDKLSNDLEYKYFRIWQYMMLRKGYWKDLPGPRPPTSELCSNAIERWGKSARSNKKYSYK